MNRQLRRDEEFVIRCLADYFSGTWRCGENPPDAYLLVGDRVIAVEVSILMEFRHDGRGGTVSNLSDQMPAIQLVNDLKKDLHEQIPDGWLVTLGFESPFLNKRAVERPLKAKICELLSNRRNDAIEVEETFSGNKINIRVDLWNSAEKMVAIIAPSSLPHQDIPSNAHEILEERIKTKANKCNSMEWEGPVWLALLDQYFLADSDTYRNAMQVVTTDHPFEKILFISHSGAVTVLFEI